MIGWGFLHVLSLCFDRCAQGELRRAERTAARLIDDIGWSTPMAPARSAAASPGKLLPQRAPQPCPANCTSCKPALLPAVPLSLRGCREV